jgi:hypothetical protein
MAYHDIQDVIWIPPSSSHYMSFQEYTSGPYMRNKRYCEDVVILYEHCIRDCNINTLLSKTFISSHHVSPKQCKVLLPSLSKPSFKTNKSYYQPVLTQNLTSCSTCIENKNTTVSTVLFDFGCNNTLVPFTNPTTQFLTQLENNSNQKISMDLKKNVKKKSFKKSVKKKLKKMSSSEKDILQTKGQKRCQSLCTSPYSDIVVYIDDDSTSTSGKTPTCNVSVVPF